MLKFKEDDEYDSETCKSLGKTYAKEKAKQRTLQTEIVFAGDVLCHFPPPLVELLYDYCRDSPKKFDAQMLTKPIKRNFHFAILDTLPRQYNMAYFNYKRHSHRHLLLLEATRWKHHGQACLQRFQTYELQGEWKEAHKEPTNPIARRHPPFFAFTLAPGQLEAAQRHLYEQMTRDERRRLCVTHKDIPLRIGFELRGTHETGGNYFQFTLGNRNQELYYTTHNHPVLDSTLTMTLQLSLTGIFFPIQQITS